MATYIAEFRRKDYTTADALRPDPKWGKRTFTIETDRPLAPEEERALCAQEVRNAPTADYRLFQVRRLGEPEVVVWPAPRTGGAAR